MTFLKRWRHKDMDFLNNWKAAEQSMPLKTTPLGRMANLSNNAELPEFNTLVAIEENADLLYSPYIRDNMFSADHRTNMIAKYGYSEAMSITVGELL